MEIISRQYYVNVDYKLNLTMHKFKINYYEIMRLQETIGNECNITRLVLRWHVSWWYIMWILDKTVGSILFQNLCFIMWIIKKWSHSRNDCMKQCIKPVCELCYSPFFQVRDCHNSQTHFIMFVQSSHSYNNLCISL